MPKQQVEQSLADLGISTIADRIPQAMEYYLGFELVTANEENTRAAGILGFQVGNELLYIPTLFLNGKTKGTETLLLKNSDVFTSNTKQWWEYLTTRAPGVSGEGADLPPGLPAQPNPISMRLFNQPPQIGGKIASADELSQYPDIDQLPGWKDNEIWNKEGQIFPDAYDMLNRWVKTAMHDELNKTASGIDISVPTVLKSLGRGPYVSFMKWALANPEVMDRLLYFYDADELKLDFPEEKVIAKTASEKGIQKVARFSISDLYANPDQFSPEEKASIMRSGGAIFDKRAEEEKTPLYKEDYLSRFDAPRDSAFYEIVNKQGDLTKAFVAVTPFLLDAPLDNYPGKIVVDPSSGIYRGIGRSEDLVVRSSHKTEEAIWKEKLGSLPSVGSATPNKTYMLINEAMQVSAPFQVKNKSGGKDGVDLMISTPYSVRIDSSRLGYWDDNVTVRIVDRDDFEIKKIGNIVFVPKGWKLIELDEDSSSYSYRGEPAKKKIYDSLSPGTTGTITAALLNKGIYDLHLNKTASSYTFSSGKHAHRITGENEAVWWMVSRLGTSEADARDFIKTASDGNPRGVKCQVKIAYSMGDMMGSEPLPAINNQMGNGLHGAMEIQPQTEIVPMESQQQEIPNSDGWNNDDANWDKIKPQHLDFLMRAADSANKNVFDPAMLGMLLRTTRAGAQVEQWLPDLVNANDINCRLLLLFYWHNNEFADSYGKDEMAEFEDQLLNLIKVMGTVVLFLKQKAGESPNSKIDAFEGN